LADEHVQEFEKAVLEAGYEGYPLVAEFKCLLNSGLRRRLMELQPMPVTIQQWYDKAITMDRQWKVARTEESFYRKVNATGISATVLQESDAATTWTASEYWTVTTRPECDGC